jgi:hypothetical protein
MIKKFSLFSKKLGIHDRVNLRTCLFQNYSRKSLNSLGFNISKSQKRYCTNDFSVCRLHNNSVNNKGGRKKLSEDISEKISSFLIDHSSESRFVIRKSFFYFF